MKHFNLLLDIFLVLTVSFVVFFAYYVYQEYTCQLEQGVYINLRCVKQAKN